MLQKWGLLVSEEMHRAHHRTFDTGTCVSVCTCVYVAVWGLTDECVRPSIHHIHPAHPKSPIPPNPPPQTTGFPVLSGLSDPLINALHALVPNQWVWLALFLGMTLGGVQLLTLAYLAAYRAVTGDAGAGAVSVAFMALQK